MTFNQFFVRANFALLLISINIALAPFAQVEAQPVQKPQALSANAPPIVMLTMSRDHKLFYEAYNDYSDINGDGVIDRGYKPSTIDYYGLFDSFKCYTYSSSNGRFEPNSFTSNKKCSGMWSGDFLNYVTTSRIDALRRVLYGGMRSTDTSTLTVLERAYVPQDAHSWGKEYPDAASPYNISDYTPFSTPANGNRILFANVTPITGSSASDTGAPLLRVWVTTQNTLRIWDWLSKEQPVAHTNVQVPDQEPIAISPTDFIVRVEVCRKTLLEDECSGYPRGSASPTVYKPNGILHDFGENGAMHFGLLTGSYDRPNDGGVLRKNISSFADEVNLTTGQFAGGQQGIVSTINRLRVQGFRRITQSWGDNRFYDCGWRIEDPATTNIDCADWGNPIGEMMYETTRYFAGKSQPTSQYVASNPTRDSSLGLTRATWRDPYKTASNPNGVPYCSKPVQMVLSDISPSFDSDNLPGTPFPSTFVGDIPGMDVRSLANTISGKEGISGSYFIGEVLGTVSDRIPSAKAVTGLGDIRGLSPEEPTRAGSYYAASVAMYGKGTDLRTDLNDKGWAQTIDTYSIALASPLPKIQIPTPGGGVVTLVPFAKSVHWPDTSLADPNSYKPTNQIVDFYIDKIVNQPGWPTEAGTNGGRPYGRFRINFEDVEQGADHDMDAIAQYTYELLADGRVRVEVDASVYASGGIVQHMGYIISGTTADGTYLEVRDKDSNNDTWGPVNPGSGGSPDVTYFLDTGGRLANGTRESKNAAGNWITVPGTRGLPLVARRTFTPGPSTAQYIPRDPLWYAAKYGGFPDKKEPITGKVIATGVNGTVENGWDSRTAGQPNNYFLVTNAGTLRDNLRTAFLDIQARTASATSATSGSTSVTEGSRSYEATFTTPSWVGAVEGFSIARNGAQSQLWKTSNSSFANHTTRKVFTFWNDTAIEFKTSGANSLPATTGIANAFDLPKFYPTISADASLNWPSLTTNAQRNAVALNILVNYIRGDRSKEKSTANGTLRERTELLGDIVNSNIAYASNTDFGFRDIRGTEGSSYQAYIDWKKNNSNFRTVYVGANDGMFHAFDGETGVERFAFVPSGVFSKLYRFAQPGNEHEYYVDGRVVLSDAYRSGAWTTVVVGSTGAGGKSIFALDVKDPSGSTSNVLWEITSDKAGFAEMGYPIGDPIIARTSDSVAGDGTVTAGRWVAIFANGYWGTGRQAVVYVVDLFTGTQLKKIVLESTSASNGLGSLAPLIDGGELKGVFGGDLMGNMWKINASERLPSNWSAIAVAQARGPDGTTPQPITATPTVAFLGEGAQVFFGTGKLFDSGDRTNTDVQSVYGIWARTDPATPYTRDNLVKLEIETETATGRSVAPVGTVSKTAKGWVLDLKPKNGAGKGERVISPLHYTFGYVDFNTWAIGDAADCEPGGESWTMSLAGSGIGTLSPRVDVNGDNKVDESDKVGGRFASGRKLAAGTMADPKISFILGSNTDSTSKGSYQINADGTKTLNQSVLGGGACPPCSVRRAADTRIECVKTDVCAPDSWNQLQ